MAQVADPNADAHALTSRVGLRVEILLLVLMGIIILLMLAIAGLFIRMNQLQVQIIAALQPLQGMKSPDAWQKEALSVGEKAPAFSLPDSTGRPVSLQDFAGRRLLLAFTSTQCPGCVQVLPALRVFAEKHRDVQVVVFVQGTDDEIRRLVEEQRLNLPVVRGDAQLAAAYKVHAVPFFYAVSESGDILGSGFANTVERLETIASGEKR